MSVFDPTEQPGPGPVNTDDLDRADRADRWRLVATLLAVLLAAIAGWALYSSTTKAEDKAVSEASQKFTLAQQVAAACAVKEQADDLGGLCASATQIVKEGPAGSVGLQGPPGHEGPVGPLGPKGEPGVRGVQGVPGLTGAQGLFGERGTNGADGAPGPVGAAGPAGADSIVAGPAGPPGPAGVDGLPGPTGASGAAGPAGVDGQTPTAMTCLESPTVPETFDCTVTAWRSTP